MSTAYEQRESPIRVEAPDFASEPFDNSIVALAKELVGGITGDDAPGLAAEVAYHAIFSIPALLVVLVTLGAVIDNLSNFDLATRLQILIDENAPQSTRDILDALVLNAVDRVDGGAASIGLGSSLVLAVWAGSNGVAALIKAFNRAYYASEMRSYPKKKAMAILLTIILAVMIASAFALWVFGGQVGNWIAAELQMGATFDRVWNLSRIPVGLVVIMFVLAVLYNYGPTVKLEFRWVLPGAVFSTFAWGLLVLGFSFYLRFASPGSAYGALGGMLVFLFFLYVTAFVFLVGAEVNAMLARRYDRRYRRVLQQDKVVNAGSVAPAGRGLVRELQPVPSGSLLVGVATVAGILAASFLRHRN